MIAFDTNLLVRYLTGDDEIQCKKVDSLIEKHAGERSIFISDIVLVEIEWVLTSVYSFSRSNIADAFNTIFSVGQFRFRDKELLKRALQKYRNGLRDFSDCVIGEDGKSLGAKTYTFDKELRKDQNFEVI
jgi:predicted nucleic-acid-binding protein